MTLRRIVLAIALGTIASCATIAATGARTPLPAPPMRAVSGGDTCLWDSDCPVGSCRFGECSPIPPDPPGCTNGDDCHGGVCFGIDCQ